MVRTSIIYVVGGGRWCVVGRLVVLRCELSKRVLFTIGKVINVNWSN